MAKAPAAKHSQAAATALSPRLLLTFIWATPSEISLMVGHDGRITVAVQSVEANGNLRVKGDQEIFVNEEKQRISVEGSVRPQDILTDNTVLSTRLGQAKIEMNERQLGTAIHQVLQLLDCTIVLGAIEQSFAHQQMKLI